MEDSIGILCFSDVWSSPLMWAHYGDKHKGLCLGFDVADHLITRVSYEPHRFLLEDLRDMADLKEQHVIKVFSTKYKDWAYEREHRCFVALTDADPITGHHFVTLDGPIVLREVILGARCGLSIGKAAKLIQSIGDVLVFKARPAFNSFSIVRNMRRAAINVPARTTKRAPPAAAATAQPL